VRVEDFAFSGNHTLLPRIPTDKGTGTTSIICWDSSACQNDLRAIEGIDMGHEAQARPDRFMEKASHVLSELSDNVGIVSGHRWLITV